MTDQQRSAASNSGNSLAFRQLRNGRGEAILDPDIPIMDSLHHLFVRPNIRYLLDDYLTDATSGHRIVGSVYVEANSFYRPSGPDFMRPIGEIEFANGVGAMAANGVLGKQRLCAAIVGGANLRQGDAVAAYLDQALQIAPNRLQGVRQGALHFPGNTLKRYLPSQAPAGLLLDSTFRAGLRQVAQRQLSFDTAVFHSQLSELSTLADAFPNLPIILNHCGLAVGVGLSVSERADVFTDWRERMRDVSRRPNVHCKISGLGLPFWGFRFEERADTIGYFELAQVWRPYVETVIELFGATRCMMGSNYPPDSSSSGFVPLWNAFKHIMQQATPTEKASLFHDTATRVYRIPPDVR